MFELTISRQELVTPLLTVAGAVDRKQPLAILSNMLLKLSDGVLYLTATDIEIEITAQVACLTNSQSGMITIPAKKLIDIIRSFEDKANPTISINGELVTISEGRSRFKITALPAENFPSFKEEACECAFSIDKNTFIHLLQSTCYAISQQDVRVYLNGLFIEMDKSSITAVAMDGHRMALCRVSCELSNPLYRFLLPRKSVQEILRLLNAVDDQCIAISLGKNQFKLTTRQYSFSSKLIDTRFPPYAKAIPRDQDKQVIVDGDLFKRTLLRIIILAPEKSRGVLLHIQPGQVTLIANNQEREEAVETIVAETTIEDLKIGMNASYLIDLLNHIKLGPIRLSMKDADSSILVEPIQEEHYQYVLMPMKL